MNDSIYPEAGIIEKGEVIVGKAKPDGSTYVRKMGHPGTGKWLPSNEEAWDYVRELMEDNNEDG